MNNKLIAIQFAIILNCKLNYNLENAKRRRGVLGNYSPLLIKELI